MKSVNDGGALASRSRRAGPTEFLRQYLGQRVGESVVAMFPLPQLRLGQQIISLFERGLIKVR
jgi:hypothetical protein